MTEQAHLVYRRAWTGRVAAALHYGPMVEPIDRTVDPIVGQVALTGSYLALATSGARDVMAVLTTAFPLEKVANRGVN